VRFVAPDGSVIQSTGFGMGLDAGDKAANKAMSAGFKYAVFDGLVVPVAAGALEDPDHYGPPPVQSVREPKTASKRKQAGWPSPKDMEAMDVEELRALAREIDAAEGKESTAYQQCAGIGKRKAGKA
jgi:hypothetical protein